MTSNIMKKSFGFPRGPVNTPQDGGASQGFDPGTGNDETSTMIQESVDGLSPQSEPSTEGPTHIVHTRTKNLRSASINAQVESTVQAPDDQAGEPLSSSNDTSVVMETTAPEVQATDNDEQGKQQPAAEEQSIGDPDTVEATQENHSTASPQVSLAPPIPPPVRNGRASSPRNDGLKSFTVRIEPKYHARVKKAARGHGITVKRMVVMMIENCFPEN